MTAIELPGGRRLEMTYTGAGLLSRVTDGLGNYLAYTYDLSGRRIGEENHDPANTLTRTLSYEYDARGRLDRILYPDTFDENLQKALYSDEGIAILELTSLIPMPGTGSPPMGTTPCTAGPRPCIRIPGQFPMITTSTTM